MTGDPVFCQCSSPWWGTVPPICPVHNPAAFTSPTTTTFTGFNYAPHGLSDEDVERIARRLAELLKGSE